MNKLFYQCPDLDTFKTLKFAADRNNTEYITYTDSSVSVYGTPDIKWNQICFVLDDENPFIYINGRIIYDSEDILNNINNLNTKITKIESIIPHDYSKQYLTFEALENGTFQFTNAINYSIDNGITWVALAADTATPTITVGNKIMWKAELAPSSSNPYGIGTFSSTGNFNVEGNAMSLLYGDNFIGQIDLTDKNYTFYQLFNSCSKLINANNLSLPATTLSSYCYQGMFQRCTSLITAPELPATTLATDCYNNMFSTCTSLITAPKLPATILANKCYYTMFAGCTSLITAPELPATTLANQCYSIMFASCTSLTTAPKLPAITLVFGCYIAMFNGCTSLTTAPELPAITLADQCYMSMFSGCINLNYIKAMFTTIPSSSSSSTGSWVYGVAANGTFIKNSAAEWNITGTNAVPTGWTVYTDEEYEIVRKYELPNEQVQADWEETDSTSYAYIQNKPDLSNFLTIETQSNWNETNTSSAAYIQNKPTIPAAQIQADWNQTTNTALDYIKNKPEALDKIYYDNSSGILYVGGSINKYLYLRSDDGITINVMDDGDINLNTINKAYYNNKEIATKDDIPTIPTTSTTVTQNDTNPVSGGAVYNRIADLIGTAPAALDTLGEIATALNNDADLAATLTNQITSKVPKVSNPTTDNFASFNSDGTIKDSSYSASSFITSIKTINNESLVGSGNIVISGLPQVSASDNGKILMVVNGQWQLVSPSILYSGSGVPNNAQGNNGDLYMQTD